MLGRGTGDDGDLGDDPRASRRHARVRRVAGLGLIVEDLGSTNGTVVNGARITGQVRVRHGDRLLVGSTELEVVDPPSVPAPAPARLEST